MKVFLAALAILIPTPLLFWLAYLAAVEHDAARGAVAGFWIFVAILAAVAGLVWLLAIVGAFGAHARAKKGAA